MTSENQAATFDLRKHREQVPMVKDGVVYFADDAVAMWTNQRVGGGSLVPVLYCALGVLHPEITDEYAMAEGPENLLLNLPNWLAAGCFFHNVHRDESPDDASDVCITVASHDPNMPLVAHPTVIKRCLEWPFQVQNLRRITAEIDEGGPFAARAVRNAELLGFKLEGRKRQGGSKGKDILMYGLLRSECRIWNERASLKLETVAA